MSDKKQSEQENHDGGEKSAASKVQVAWAASDNAEKAHKNALDQQEKLEKTAKDAKGASEKAPGNKSTKEIGRAHV